MTNKKKISQIFSDIKTHPLMYLGSYDPEKALTFILGFYCGYKAGSFDNVSDSEARNKILLKRGWKIPSILINKEMEEKGLSPEKIVEELFTIEVETWKLLEEETGNA